MSQNQGNAASTSAYGASPSNLYSGTAIAAYNPSQTNSSAQNRQYGMSANISQSGSSIGPGYAYESKKSGNNSESSDSEENK